MENKKTTSSTQGGPPSNVGFPEANKMSFGGVRARGRLTVTLHIGGMQVEKLTPEQVQRIADRLSESMSEYYSNHITEFQKIKSRELAE